MDLFRLKQWKQRNQGGRGEELLDVLEPEMTLKQGRTDHSESSTIPWIADRERRIAERKKSARHSADDVVAVGPNLKMVAPNSE